MMLRDKRLSGSNIQNQGWLARQKGPEPQELILRRLAKSQQNWQGHPALGNLASPKANPNPAAGPHGFVSELGAWGSPWSGVSMRELLGAIRIQTTLGWMQDWQGLGPHGQQAVKASAIHEPGSHSTILRIPSTWKLGALRPFELL